GRTSNAGLSNACHKREYKGRLALAEARVAPRTLSFSQPPQVAKVRSGKPWPQTLITLPERDEYDMLCSQNLHTPFNIILTYSVYRAKHWETKGYNRPRHSRSNQDNKSHTMDGNMTRISQIV
ncbi:MAG: hypothetical protein ACXVCM_22365, partial [Ktedonobacteraceae bacterium]